MPVKWKSSGGKILWGVGTGGGGFAVAFSSNCCCCACSFSIPLPCSACVEQVANQWHVTISGVSVCACSDCLGTSVETSGCTIDGTYVLSPDMPGNGDCCWSTTITCTTITYSPAINCIGPMTGTCATLTVKLCKTLAGNWTFQIADCAGNLFFDGTLAAFGPQCCTQFSLSSNITACGCQGGGFPLLVATGGSAVFSPC